jgi:hypothetical protein
MESTLIRRLREPEPEGDADPPPRPLCPLLEEEDTGGWVWRHWELLVSLLL